MKEMNALTKNFIIFILIVSVIVSFHSCGKGKKTKDSSGLYWIEQNGKYGCINSKGEIVVNPQFESSWSEFSEGLASIKIGRKWGYIDKTGKIVINPQFEGADKFSEGLAGVRIGNVSKSNS